MNSAASMAQPLGYNENKVAMGTAKVIYHQGINDIKNPKESFAAYEKANVRTVNVALHLSINPSAGENQRLTPETITKIAQEYMEGMGYGRQPYIIYQHDDIDRRHYHVVSIKVDKNGRKIKDNNNFKTAKALLERLGKKYGFVIGNGEKQKKQQVIKGEWTPKPKMYWERDVMQPIAPFDPKAGHIYKQVEKIVAGAMEYKFHSVDQFIQILSDYGLKTTIHESAEGGIPFTFQGYDQKTGKLTSKPIDGDKLYIPSYGQICFQARTGQYATRRGETMRVSNILQSCLPKAKSQTHLYNMLAKQGISMTVQRSESGSIDNVFFIDHRTRCCFSTENDSHFFDLRVFQKADRQVRKPYLEAEAHHQAAFLAHAAFHSGQEETVRTEMIKEFVKESISTVLTSLFNEGSRHYADEEIMRQGRRR